MTRKKLLQIIDREKIKSAIQAAEHRTSGEICVSVAPFFWGSIEKAADKAFVRMGVARTKHRNGVLFFVVPSRRKFVVLGDTGIHEHVGQEFWHQRGRGRGREISRRRLYGGPGAGNSKSRRTVGGAFPVRCGDR